MGSCSGRVLSIRDGVARVAGLANVQAEEMVEFSGGIKGMALNLTPSDTSIVIFGDDRLVREGDWVYRTRSMLTVPSGPGMLGRVVDGLGRPIDGKGTLNNVFYRPAFALGPKFISRESIRDPIYTGIRYIDSVLPIGKGQRQVILGDRQTGKTSIAQSTILYQRQNATGIHNVYVAIGQKQSAVGRLVQNLEEKDALKCSTVVSAPASDPVSLQYLAPYTGCTIGEYFRDNGQDSLVIYDDLSKHAMAYRQMSLLLHRPPGREMYPEDIFHLHSRLLERACKLSANHGGGSLTAFPIVETLKGEFSSYIPTNIVSMADGQIVLDSRLFLKGIRPAINAGLSVSRVGSITQTLAMKTLSNSLKVFLSQQEDFWHHTDPRIHLADTRIQKILELFKQPHCSPIPIERQIMVLFALENGYLDNIDLELVGQFESQLNDFMHKHYPQVLAAIRKGHSVDLGQFISEIVDKFQRKQKNEIQ